jgi:hypothetical protein
MLLTQEDEIFGAIDFAAVNRNNMRNSANFGSSSPAA